MANESIYDIFKRYQGNGVNCHEGSDKGTMHTYLPVYESLFSSKRHDKIRMLEIGVCSGGSLRAWTEYFTHPDAEIVGVDISTNMLSWDLTVDPRMKFLIADATTEATAANLGNGWDIVVDDGSHMLEHQLATLRLYGPRIRIPEGIIVIEDILTTENIEPLKAFGEYMGMVVEVFDHRPESKMDADIMMTFRWPEKMN